jgi:hypothetical protein
MVIGFFGLISWWKFMEQYGGYRLSCVDVLRQSTYPVLFAGAAGAVTIPTTTATKAMPAAARSALIRLRD